MRYAMWRRVAALMMGAGLVCAGGCGGGGLGETDLEIGVGDLVMPGSAAAGAGQIEGFVFVPERSRQAEPCVLTISTTPLPGQSPAVGITVTVAPEGFTKQTDDRGYFKIMGVTLGSHEVSAEGVVEINGEKRTCVAKATLEATQATVPEGFGHEQVSTDQPGWDILELRAVKSLIADVCNPGDKTAVAWAVAGQRADATREIIEGFQGEVQTILPPPGQASRQASEDLYFLTGVQVAPGYSAEGVQFELPNKNLLKQDLKALMEGDINELHFYGIAQTENPEPGRQEDDDAIIILSNIRLKVKVGISGL